MKTLLAVVLAGLAASAFADGRVIDLAKVTNPVLSAHVDGKPAPAPEGTSVAVTEEGVKLVCNFTSAGHDAAMFSFDVNEPAFSSLTMSYTVSDGRQVAFVVLTDANGESHCFKSGAVNSGQRQTRKLAIKEKNDYPGEYFATRWGGDDNQRIDWPVKKITLGINDTPDTFTGGVKATFHSLTLE